MTLHLTKNYFQFFILILFLSPTFLFSQNAPEIQTALQHLRMQRATLNLEEGDIENYRISDFYKTQHNGVAHIYLLQQHEGLDVHNAMININVLPDGRLLNIGNRFIRNIAGKVNATQPSIERTDALQAVLFKFVDVENHVPEELEQRSSQHYIYNNQGLALDPISVKLMYALQEDQTVRLVWQVKLYQLDGQHAWDVQVDALSGNILNYYDEVIHCDFNHTDDNCPTGEHTHENKNKNQNQNNVITPPAPVMGNTYNVFPMPVESPNHGDRAMVVNPSDSTASPFGWHDVDGIDGEEYTITRGNNAHAYHDIFFQNAPIGGEPDGGALLEFDFPFDIDNDTVYQQLDAATVNLFYWNNICHDLWYHYGFDEASGNFQQNNYGNDGLGGDYVRAEAVDGIGSNNANFFTPNDGQLPRMQMFIWRGEDLPQGRNFLDVTFGSGSTENMVMRPASFGGQLPFTPIVGNVILVDDGVDTPTDACENIGNDDELVGRIALVDRGECSYGEQVLKAEQEGAVAVIVCNNDNNGASSITTMFPGAVGSQVTIPAVMISFQNCNALKNDIENVVVSLGAPDSLTLPSPGPTGIDSDFDNGVIVHEYGHGISNRLTGGPSASSCLRNREQAGEGWSDWFALVMTATSADNGEQGRGIATYLSEESPAGGGIREHRYSRSILTNPHTYGDLPDVSVPHGVGSIFAVTMWDLYWNLVDIYGFDDDLYKGTGGNNMAMQLVLDGVKLQPCSPTFLDSRDAIIAADQANYGGAHFCMIWETFARRGIGFSAEVEGIEAFDVPLSCQFRLKLDKMAVGEIEAGEVMTYTLEVKNDSPDTLENVVITDRLPDGVTLVDGSVSCGNSELSGQVLSIPLGQMLTGDSIVCTYDVLVDDDPVSYIIFEDDMENSIINWSVSSALGTGLFQLNTDNPFDGNVSWFALNQNVESDMRLTTSDAYMISDTSARLSFWHFVETQFSRDGGRVEISTDGGNTWEDQKDNFIQTGYNSLLLNDIIPGNNFGFSGDSRNYQQSIIDLSSYQGQEIMFRFRFVSDDSESGIGWWIDNVQLFGNVHDIKNSACVSSDLNENNCDEVTTRVFGEPIVSNENITPSLGVSIFPNPTDGKVFVKIENNNNIFTSLKLVGMDGRMLKEKRVDFGNGLIEFDVSEFPNGIYLIQVQTEETQVVQKLILSE